MNEHRNDLGRSCKGASLLKSSFWKPFAGIKGLYHESRIWNLFHKYLLREMIHSAPCTVSSSSFCAWVNMDSGVATAHVCDINLF